MSTALPESDSDGAAPSEARRPASPKRAAALHLAGGLFSEAAGLARDGHPQLARRFAYTAAERLALAVSGDVPAAVLASEPVRAAAADCARQLAGCDPVPAVLRERMSRTLAEMQGADGPAAARLLHAQAIGAIEVIKSSAPK
jgi:hypothetical protein